MKTMRIDKCVYGGNIGIGEKVNVFTHSGDFVAYGDVINNNPFGITIQEPDSSFIRFYQSELYLFNVDEPEIPTVTVNDLTKMTIDQRVRHKLGMYESSQDDKEDKENKGDKEDHKRSKDDEKDGDIDIDKLPERIKSSIVTVGDLSNEEINIVLGEIGEVAMRVLKRIGIREKELYGLLDRIQANIAQELEKKN